MQNLFNLNIAKNAQIFGIHGGGNIGLGCLAEIVNNSNVPYQIVATSKDLILNKLINTFRQYSIRHNMGETLIQNVNMINAAEGKLVSDLYYQAKIMAICLPENAIPQVSFDIAQGLIKRYKKNKPTLSILILMNRVNADFFVKKEVEKALYILTQNRSLITNILSNIEFVPTVVDRMVSRIDKKNIYIHLKDDLQKMYLFNTEKSFSFYVPNSFKEANLFPKMIAVKDIVTWADVKNKFINGPHAMLAWVGGLFGCQSIAEAIRTPSIALYLQNLLETEILPILNAAYPNLKKDEMSSLKDKFIKRCQASINDSIIRVGRDPLRKLSVGGRIRGLIELKRKYNLQLPTPEIERGIAAAILYATNKIDPTNSECQKIYDIYTSRKSYKDVLCYKENGSNNFLGLDVSNDAVLIQNILYKIHGFQKLFNSCHTLC